MSKESDDQDAINAALQEPMIDALHQDERINAFLYNGEEPNDLMIEDMQFQRRVICIVAATDVAVADRDLSGIFADMAQCARAVGMDDDIPQQALAAVKEHAQAYREGKYKPTMN